MHASNHRAGAFCSALLAVLIVAVVLGVFSKDRNRNDIANVSNPESTGDDVTDRAKPFKAPATVIDGRQKTQDEVADGLILRIDRASNLVWINLGEADSLKPHMTFAVYGQDGQGDFRPEEKAKGKAEVTRILGTHLSEARIVQDDLLRPIVVNDVVYTPLWNPGMLERVSIVGLIDLDGDGKSDREEFKKMLAVLGTQVDHEVDDEGNRTPANGKITAQTRYLALGDFPDPDQMANEDQRALAIRIQKHRDDMIEEAEANGVRVFTVGEYLSSGSVFHRKKKFRPRLIAERPFHLKAGTGSTSTNAQGDDQSPPGSTSRLGSDIRRRDPERHESGSTSKLFGQQKQ